MVVNLFGAPSSGKSTGAAYIFSKLKMAGVNAELVTEFAKDKVWEETKAVFQNQIYIFGKQDFKVSRCYKKVDVVITDSPIYNSKVYNNFSGEKKRLLDELILETFNGYENVNFFINRVKAYNPVGRFQTEDEAKQVAIDIHNMLLADRITFFDIDGNEAGYDKIVQQVLERLKK